jgi:hypothetical protein
MLNLGQTRNWKKDQKKKKDKTNKQKVEMNYHH